MWDEFMVYRKPSANELNLISQLISKAHEYPISSGWKDSLYVEDMIDGGMGSLKLSTDNNRDINRKFGSQISDLMFKDEDGVGVIASLNLDADGELYELDMWKINYEPLISIPGKIKDII